MPSKTLPLISKPHGGNEVLSFIQSSHAGLPPGERQIWGNDLRVLIVELTTFPHEKAVVESHRQYVDVHVVLDGEEMMQVWPTSALTVRTEYENEKDVMFYHPPDWPGALVRLRPSYFALFFPHDAHRPGMMIHEPAKLKKLVFKVGVALVLEPFLDRGSVN